MKMFVTEIMALDPKDNKVKKWCGPNVPGINESTAQQYCELNGLGYCKVIGELVMEIPCREGTLEPDFSKAIDYEKPQLN